MNPDVQQIAERIQQLRPRLDPLYREIEKVLIGRGV